MESEADLGDFKTAGCVGESEGFAMMELKQREWRRRLFIITFLAANSYVYNLNLNFKENHEHLFKASSIPPEVH